MKTKYTVGFLFSEEADFVALIQKNKPVWQAGRLNGIGGHIEEGESPEACQRREFKEETGVDIDGWEKFCVLTGENYEVTFFVLFSERILECRTMEQEDVFILNVHDVMKHNIVPNLRWLLPMALERNIMANVYDGDCYPKSTKLYLTRQRNYEFMITKNEPDIINVGETENKDAYVVPGDPIGVRHLCDAIFKHVGAKDMQPLQSKQINLTLTEVK